MTAKIVDLMKSLMLSAFICNLRKSDSIYQDAPGNLFAGGFS